jgi:hypothetical protein
MVAMHSRPDLSQLSDAELESLLPLAERQAHVGAEFGLNLDEQAMMSRRWSTRCSHGSSGGPTNVVPSHLA